MSITKYVAFNFRQIEQDISFGTFDIYAFFNDATNLGITNQTAHDIIRMYYHEWPEELFDILYGLAYEHGHSSGWAEVVNYMSDYEAIAKIWPK